MNIIWVKHVLWPVPRLSSFLFQIFTVGQKSIRHSGKTKKFLKNFDVLKKLLYLCENYVMLGQKFWYVRQNFRMVVEKYLICRCRENFFGMSRKKILINVQFVCSGKLYCAPPPPPQTRLGPYSHVQFTDNPVYQTNRVDNNTVNTGQIIQDLSKKSQQANLRSLRAIIIACLTKGWSICHIK
jgi:hypothetical protein